MKRLLAMLLVAATALGLCAAALPASAEGTDASVLEGSLFLKVSSITFSLVGECEDIYLGVIPRELVTWESENPSVVSVENGVLTANGSDTDITFAGSDWSECKATVSLNKGINDVEISRGSGNGLFYIDYIELK